jgi:hypothetical protein
MTGENPTRRRVILGTGLLVGLAGCASLSDGLSTSTDTETTRPTATESSGTTQTDTETETTSSTESGDDGPGYKDSHWHGRLFFEVDGDLVNFDQPKYYLDTIEDDRPETVHFHFHEGSAHGPNEWSNEKQIVTFQRALNLLPGIGYERQTGNHVVTYEGETYDGSQSGTSISIHEGTERIDPTAHEVEHNDNFWVRIQTGDDSDSGDSDGDERSGTLVVDVNNRRLDFSADAYREADSETFEFRDDGDPYRWYSQDGSVTLEQALNTLPNLEYSEENGGDVVTYETDDDHAGTYRSEADATSIVTRQRTNDVDPTDYELQDGDILWVYVHTSAAPDNEH